MSHKSRDDEYTENLKTVETYSAEEDENYEQPEDEEVRDNINYEECDKICVLTRLLQEYAKNQGLPICQYLSTGLMIEFVEGDSESE
jgi:hypothetical protein